MNEALDRCRSAIAARYSAAGQPRMATAKGRVPGKGEFALRRENPDTIVRNPVRRLQEERRLAEVRPVAKSAICWSESSSAPMTTASGLPLNSSDENTSTC